MHRSVLYRTRESPYGSDMYHLNILVAGQRPGKVKGSLKCVCDERLGVFLPVFVFRTGYTCQQRERQLLNECMRQSIP
jgi:hypothetical protein